MEEVVLLFTYSKQNNTTQQHTFSFAPNNNSKR